MPPNAPPSRAPRPRRAGAAKQRRPKAAPPEAPVEPAGDPRIVAVTGAFGSLGRRVVRLLEQDPDVERVVAIDVRSAMELAERDGEPMDPRRYLEAHRRLSAHTLDLTAAGADRELASVLATERAGSVIHLAFLSSPTHALEMAHELETIGTMYVLHACAQARIKQLVSLSSAMCYGARPDNPAWITESQPLRPPPSRSLRDKAEADRQVQRFRAEQPDAVVAIARVGAVLGSAPDHFWTRTFARPVVPAALGYDPLMQLLLVEDAAFALHALWKAKADGPFNVVGRGVLPLSHILTRLGRAPLYLPAGLGQTLIRALWSAQLVDMPPRFLDFLRWSWVCDGERLRAATGFAAAHDISTTLGIFQSLRGGPSLRPAPAAQPEEVT
jgi:UDP-glucose 4-epimerase